MSLEKRSGKPIQAGLGVLHHCPWVRSEDVIKNELGQLETIATTYDWDRAQWVGHNKNNFLSEVTKK